MIEASNQKTKTKKTEKIDKSTYRLYKSMSISHLSDSGSVNLLAVQLPNVTWLHSHVLVYTPPRFLLLDSL